MTSVSLDRIANALGMTESKTPDTHIWATVSSINEDGSYQVKMNGAGQNETTRAAKVCNAEVGDRVLCVVSNGQVSAIGRVGGCNEKTIAHQDWAFDLYINTHEGTEATLSQSAREFDENTYICKQLMRAWPLSQWSNGSLAIIAEDTYNNDIGSMRFTTTSAQTYNCIVRFYYWEQVV